MAVLYPKFNNVFEIFLQHVSSLYIDYSKINIYEGLNEHVEIFSSGGKFWSVLLDCKIKFFFGIYNPGIRNQIFLVFFASLSISHKSVGAKTQVWTWGVCVTAIIGNTFINILQKMEWKLVNCTNNIQVFSRGDIKLESLHASTVCSIFMETIIAVTTICSLSVCTGCIRVTVIARFLKTFIYICNGDLHCRRNKYRRLTFLVFLNATVRSFVESRS